MTAVPERRIVLEDITVPAHLRRNQAVEAPPTEGVRACRLGRTSGTAANLTFLAGVWLVIGGFSLYWRDTGVFDAYWNDVVVGVALAVVALVTVLKSTGSLTLTRFALGGWLVAAPFALGYGQSPYGSRAFWDEIVVGVLVIALSLLSPRTRPADGDTAGR